MTDFDHIEDEIESIEQKIQMYYENRNYDELNNDEKENVILDHFFKGNRRYITSSKKLRIGLDAYRNSYIENDVKIVKITYKNGKSHYQVRNKNGTFGRWIK